MSGAPPNVLFSRDPTQVVGPDWLETLKGLALQAGNKRARICLHRSHDSKVQQMLIVFHRSTFIGPHRQKRDFKSYSVLSGELTVSFFDDAGKLQERHRLAGIGGERASFLRFSAARWHMAMPRSEWTAFIETGEGPFAQDFTEYAPWGPDYANAKEVQAFIDKIERDHV